ncbi:MAG: DNA-binding protein WhiA [Clostridia bacterium]|nr:DNA-binding protein WhiA [Clostridia bacterium]
MATRERQSFAAGVRQELIRLPAGKSCCMLSEISALTQTSGHLAFRGGGWISVSYRLEDAGVARRLFQLLKKRLGVNPALHFTQTSRLGGRRTCVLTLTGADARTLLDALHMTETDEAGQIHLKRTVPRHPMTRQCCRRAFLRGAFLGAGTVTNPEKGYHFEWKAEDSHLRQNLGRLLEKSDLPFHVYTRYGKEVVYLKGAQEIADALALMGAGHSVLAMENTRIQKQMRAAAVRAANCDEHNGEKMLDAAQKQAEAIRQISLKQGLFTLPPALQEMARLRLENPELSLKELGEMMEKPVTKSGAGNRMKRLMDIAARMEEDET